MDIGAKAELKGEGRPVKIGAGEIVFNVVITGEGHKVEKKEGK